jgi:hypothetical protein
LFFFASLKIYFGGAKMTQKITLSELRAKHPLFFERNTQRFFKDVRKYIYKDYLIVKFKRELSNTTYEGYNIYQITNDDLRYVNTVKSDYKHFIDNLKEGAQ